MSTEVKLDAASLEARAAEFGSIASQIVNAVGTAESALSGTAAMAGDGDAGRAFAQEGDGAYDDVADDVLRAPIAVADILYGVETALINTARNYEAAQKPGAMQTPNVTIDTATPAPGAGGYNVPKAYGEGKETFDLGKFGEGLQWALDQVGVKLPTGDEGLLGTAEGAWRALGNALTQAEGRVRGLSPLAGMTLPQQGQIDAVQDEIATMLGEMATSANAMADQVGGYKTNLEQTKATIQQFIQQMAIEIAAEIGLTILLGILTGGLGAFLGAAKATATAMRWAVKIKGVIDKLGTLAKALRMAARIGKSKYVTGAVKQGIIGGLASGISTVSMNKIHADNPYYQQQDVGTAMFSSAFGAAVGSPVTRLVGGGSGPITRLVDGTPTGPGFGKIARTFAGDVAGGAADGVAADAVDGGGFNPLSSALMGALIGGGMSGASQGINAGRGALGLGRPAPVATPGDGGSTSPSQNAGSNSPSPTIDTPTPGAGGSPSSTPGAGSGNSGNSGYDGPTPGAGGSSANAPGGGGAGNSGYDGPTPGGGADGGSGPGDGGSVDLPGDTPASPEGLPDGGPADAPASPEGAQPDGPASPEGAQPESPASPESPAAPEGAQPDGPASPEGAQPESPAAPEGAQPDGPASPEGAQPDGPASPEGAQPDGDATPVAAAAGTPVAATTTSPSDIDAPDASQIDALGNRMDDADPTDADPSSREQTADEDAPEDGAENDGAENDGAENDGTDTDADATQDGELSPEDAAAAAATAAGAAGLLSAPSLGTPSTPSTPGATTGGSRGRSPKTPAEQRISDMADQLRDQKPEPGDVEGPSQGPLSPAEQRALDDMVENGLLRDNGDGTYTMPQQPYDVTSPDDCSPAEMQRQYDEATAALRDMPLSEWIQRRADFINHPNRYRDATGSSKEQESTRNTWVEKRADELRKQGKTDEEAEAQARKEAKERNATHRLDMVAGGNPRDISGMGGKNENRTIGNQFKNDLVPSMQDEVIRLLDGSGLDSRVWHRLRMDVEVTVRDADGNPATSRPMSPPSNYNPASPATPGNTPAAPATPATTSGTPGATPTSTADTSTSPASASPSTPGTTSEPSTSTSQSPAAQPQAAPAQPAQTTAPVDASAADGTQVDPADAPQDRREAPDRADDAGEPGDAERSESAADADGADRAPIEQPVAADEGLGDVNATAPVSQSADANPAPPKVPATMHDPLLDSRYARLPAPESINDTVQNVNQVGAWGDRGRYLNNCHYVVNAMELRARGYNVVASPTVRSVAWDANSGTWADVYEGRFPDQIAGDWRRADGTVPSFDMLSNHQGSTPQEALAKLTESWPEGARGFIAGYWNTGGGHIFSIVKDAGGVRLVDGQVAQTDVSKYLNRMKFGGTTDIRVMRLDDLVPTSEVFKTSRPNTKTEYDETVAWRHATDGNGTVTDPGKAPQTRIDQEIAANERWRARNDELAAGYQKVVDDPNADPVAKARAQRQIQVLKDQNMRLKLGLERFLDDLKPAAATVPKGP